MKLNFLFLNLFLFFEFILTEECVKKDLCQLKSLKDKMNYFISPLSNGCNYESFSIISDYIYCLDSEFINCGFISNSDEGIKIGLGLDLSKLNKDTLIKANVAESVIEKISSYLGLKGEEAQKALENKNLTLTFDESKQLTDGMISYYYGLVTAEFNQDCKDCEIKFSQLSVKKRASIFSIYFEMKGIKQTNSDLWKLILKNEWENLSKIILKIKLPVLVKRGNYLNLKSDENKCDSRKTETLFIYGNEGLLSEEKFEVIRQFFLDYIQNTNLLFNRINFATSNRENLTSLLDQFSPLKSEIYPLVENKTTFPYLLDNYDLALAIEKGIEMFKSSAEYSETKKIIVLISNRMEGGVENLDWDKIKDKANDARRSKIKVVAILEDYLESYYDRVLQIVDNDRSNIINNKKAYEEDFICSNVTLYSKVCPLFNDVFNIEETQITLESYVKNFDQPQFYRLDRKRSEHLQKISIYPTNDLLRDIKINIFLSYTNPYPDVIMNDLSHFGRNIGRKELIFGLNRTHNETHNETNNETNNDTQPDYYTIYVGVYAEFLGFNITFSECSTNDTTCITGTNDTEAPIEERGLPGWIIFLIVMLIILSLFGIAFAIYQYINRKRVFNSHEFTRLNDRN